MGQLYGISPGHDISIILACYKLVPVPLQPGIAIANRGTPLASWAAGITLE